jgi:acyl dehydratase
MTKRETMLDKSLIGRESDPVVHDVEKNAIRRFAEALGDANPLYVDEAAAKAAGFPALVAPPTFPVTLASNDRFRHSLDLGTRNVLHGEQVIETARSIVAGDRITVKSKVADVQERAGASGTMDVLVIEDEGRDDKGELVFRTRETLILRRG